MSSSGPITHPIVYGTYMATVDVFMLSLLKAINLGWVNKAAIFLLSASVAMKYYYSVKLTEHLSIKHTNSLVLNLAIWFLIFDVIKR